MKKKKKSILVLLCLVFLFACSEKERSKKENPSPTIQRKEYNKGPLRIEWEMAPAKPLLNELIQVSLKVTTPPEYELLLPSLEEEWKNFFYFHYLWKNPPLLQNKNKVYHWEGSMEALESGEILLPPLDFRYQKKQKPQKNTGYSALITDLKLEILSDKNIAKEMDKKDIFSIQKIKDLPTQQRISKIFLVLLGLSFLFLFYFIWKKHISSSPEVEELPSPEELAEESLSLLLQKKYLENKEYRLFYFELTRIVREYIECKYDLQAARQTSEEFFLTLFSFPGLNKEEKEKLSMFLKAADIVKYAGQNPSFLEVENSLATAKNFMGLLKKNS